MDGVLNELRQKQFDYFLAVCGRYRAECGVSPRTLRWMKMEDVSVSLSRTPVRGTALTEKIDNIVSPVKRDASLVKNKDFQSLSYCDCVYNYVGTHTRNYRFSEVLAEQTSEATFKGCILKRNASLLSSSKTLFHDARYILFPEMPAEAPEDVDMEDKRYAEALDEDERNLSRLHIGDEYLITRYFLGEREAVCGFAAVTLPLCERYNHPDGAKLRLLLLDNRKELTRSMKRFQWIRDYVRNYIWI